MKQVLSAITVACAMMSIIPAHGQELRIGAITSATGSQASIGIPYRNSYEVMPKVLHGLPVTVVTLDDASDPSMALKAAKKLLAEEKVDVIFGPNLTASANATFDPIAESGTPQIATTASGIPPGKDIWAFTTPQPVSLMAGEVVKHMKTAGVKSVAYIGFGNAWGDNWEKALVPAAEKAGIKVVAIEKYMPTDASVQGQVLKVLSTQPDAVLIGGAGTPAALPHIALYDRRYKGKIYHTHGVVNADFLRVGGKAVEGGIAPAGPLAVVDQLPGDHPLKAAGSAYKKAIVERFGAAAFNPFGGYGYDAYLLLEAALPQALKAGKPGTAEFKKALRDSIERVKDVAGTQGVYSMSKSDHNGVDPRAAVMVTVQNGNWKLLP